MLKSPLRVALALLGFAALWGPDLSAETLVQKMSLAEISQRADKIFRSTVVSISNGTVTRSTPSISFSQRKACRATHNASKPRAT